MAKLVFVSAYVPKERVYAEYVGVDMCKQSFKDECDVNKIVKRFETSGMLPVVEGREPEFFDCTGLDFHRMMDVVAGAQARFDALPAHVRKRFANDPQEFVEFAQSPENRSELVKMGLTEERRRGRVEAAAMKRRKGDEDGVESKSVGISGEGIGRSGEERAASGGERRATGRRGVGVPEVRRGAVRADQASGRGDSDA